MSLTGKLVSQTEVKSSPELIFDMIGQKPNQLLKETPGQFKGFDLLDGFWGTLGSTYRVTYVAEGKAIMDNIKVTAIDEASKSVTYQAIGGEILRLYSALTATFQVETTEDGKNMATWTMDYSKLQPDTPDPTPLMNVFEATLKEINAKN